MLRRLGPEEIHRGPNDGTPTGYAHPSYAWALDEFGKVVELHRSGSRLLSRPVPGSDKIDAIGPYPFFTCHSYAELRAELKSLRRLVSVAVVPDLFSFASAVDLSETFEIVVPYKTHYIADLEIGFDRYMHRHHRRYARKGLANFDVELAEDPAAHGSEWAGLYRELVDRRGISGLQAFSPRSLSRQLEVPGCLYFRALRDGALHGALVCYLDRGVAYAHLISTTGVGQALGAQYALYWTAMESCRARARWFALGSVPGLSSDMERPGLSFFKAGWATATCQGYFCGHVMDQSAYDLLCATLGASGSQFPAYRPVQNG